MKRVEHIVKKGEISHHEQFLLCHISFQKSSKPSNCVYMREMVTVQATVLSSKLGFTCIGAIYSVYENKGLMLQLKLMLMILMGMLMLLLLMVVLMFMVM